MTSMTSTSSTIATSSSLTGINSTLLFFSGGSDEELGLGVGRGAELGVAYTPGAELGVTLGGGGGGILGGITLGACMVIP